MDFQTRKTSRVSGLVLKTTMSPNKTIRNYREKGEKKTNYIVFGAFMLNFGIRFVYSTMKKIYKLQEDI